MLQWNLLFERELSHLKHWIGSQELFVFSDLLLTYSVPLPKHFTFFPLNFPLSEIRLIPLREAFEA